MILLGKNKIFIRQQPTCSSRGASIISVGEIESNWNFMATSDVLLEIHEQNNYIYMGCPHESSTATITPIFEEKDNCAYSYREFRMLGMHAISSHYTRCVYDKCEGTLKVFVGIKDASKRCERAVVQF